MGKKEFIIGKFYRRTSWTPSLYIYHAKGAWQKSWRIEEYLLNSQHHTNWVECDSQGNELPTKSVSFEAWCDDLAEPLKANLCSEIALPKKGKQMNDVKVEVKIDGKEVKIGENRVTPKTQLESFKKYVVNFYNEEGDIASSKQIDTKKEIKTLMKQSCNIGMTAIIYKQDSQITVELPLNEKRL